MFISKQLKLLIIVLISFVSQPIHSLVQMTSKDLAKLSFEELFDIKIVTATKTPEKLSNTTFNLHVITADNINQIGAKSIYDALRHTPGLEVGVGGYGENYITMRGIYTANSEKILIMMNGHLINDVRSGSGTFQFLDNFPIENIKHIEVLFGPSSSLYGSNAFLGVINIITVNHNEIENLHVSIQSEFESGNSIGQRYNILFGKKFNNNDGITINLNVLDNNGSELYVGSDAFGRSGFANTQHDLVDFQTTLQKKSLTLFGRFMSRKAGDYFGVADVLNDNSEQKVNYGFLNARFDFKSETNTQVILQGYLDHQNSDNYYEGFPAGTIPSWHPFYPWNADGVIGETKAKETIIGGELQTIYNKYKHHTLIWGISGRFEKLHDPKFFANYNPGYLPEVQDVSDEFNWIESANRSILAIYVQDDWEIPKNIRLLTGVRFDKYSDFGTTINPRIGLLWNTSQNVDLKLSYGSAFRAPDFVSQHIKNNPLTLGNPDLNPESIRTFDGSICMKLNQLFQLSLSSYYSKLKHLIHADPSTLIFVNTGEAVALGFGIDAKYFYSKEGYVTVSYSYTDSELDNSPYPNATKSNGSVMLNYPINNRYSLNMNSYWFGKSPRYVGDTREDLKDYIIINTTLSASQILNVFELNFSVYNLFDKQYYYPSSPNGIVEDYKASNRSIVLKLKMSFNT